MNEGAGGSGDSSNDGLLRTLAALAEGKELGDAGAQKFLGELGNLGAAWQLIAVLSQVNLASAAALGRCYARALESWVTYGQASIRSIGPLVSARGADHEALAALVDETRAHLRRLRESVIEEAGEFDAQVQLFAEHLRIVVEEERPTDEPRRRARAKL